MTGKLMMRTFLIVIDVIDCTTVIRGNVRREYCMSGCMYVYLSMYLSTYLTIYLAVYPSVAIYI